MIDLLCRTKKNEPTLVVSSTHILEHVHEPAHILLCLTELSVKIWCPSRTYENHETLVQVTRAVIDSRHISVKSCFLLSIHTYSLVYP